MSAYRDIISLSMSLLNETPGPSMREILQAYRSKGDGDKELLLALLRAQTAENERIAKIAALHRSVLEVYSHSTRVPSNEPMDVSHHYPTPESPRRPSSREMDDLRRRHEYHPYHAPSSNSNSDFAQAEPSRKRHRSRSPQYYRVAPLHCPPSPSAHSDNSSATQFRDERIMAGGLSHESAERETSP
ncbi:hypothetical protein C8J56DRAFT_918093 [Mycena floridula]|nr:hypothetical protein C8J56DRAFT_918093 [Mycena floridula]